VVELTDRSVDGLEIQQTALRAGVSLHAYSLIMSLGTLLADVTHAFQRTIAGDSFS
jgi:hypothetical protein